MTLHLGVGGWLWTGRPDGATHRLVQLARHAAPLLAQGERITWLAGPAGHPDLPTDVAIRGVDIPAGPARARGRAQSAHLPGAVQDLGLTVLEAPCLPIPRLRARDRCAVAVTVHDLRDFHGWRRRWPRPLLRAIYRHQLRAADGVLTPSDATRSELAELGLCPPARVTVVANGVTVPSAPPGPSKPPTVLHVGHLEPRKNLALLLRAAGLLRDRGLEFRVVLAGRDAGDGGALRKLAASLEISRLVDFAGPVSDAQRDELYRTCTAVAVPSRCEGFGMVALEALAWGVPTLVARAGALPEVVGTAGIVLPPGEPEAWAHALARILTRVPADPAQRDPAQHDPAQHRAEVASRRARAREYSWSAAAAAWLAACRRLATPQDTAVMTK